MQFFGMKFFEPKQRTIAMPEGCNILVEDRPGDKPEFKREYTVKLDSRATMEVTCETSQYGGDRRTSGTLRQPGGNYVFFDPKKIADKIIDPVLVPLVEAACQTILAIDKQFIDSKPDTFKDRDGVSWCRCAPKA